jgi:hypothetical protein
VPYFVQSKALLDPKQGVTFSEARASIVDIFLFLNNIGKYRANYLISYFSLCLLSLAKKQQAGIFCK